MTTKRHLASLIYGLCYITVTDKNLWSLHEDPLISKIHNQSGGDTSNTNNHRVAAPRSRIRPRMADKALNGNQCMISYIAVAMGHQFHNSGLRPKVHQDPERRQCGKASREKGVLFPSFIVLDVLSDVVRCDSQNKRVLRTPKQFDQQSASLTVCMKLRKLGP